MRILSKVRNRKFRLSSSKPAILLLVDYPGWAFDNSAQSIAEQLSTKFKFEIQFVNDDPRPKLKARKYDLIHVFFWGERHHVQFGFPPERVIKEVSSHRFEDDERFGPCTPKEMAERFLGDAATLCATSKRLHQIFLPIQDRCYWTPNGIDLSLFHPTRERSGELVFGWAGNAKDPVKGLEDILLPSCGDDITLKMAPGDVNREAMNGFYNQLDVFLVGSRHEGEPLTLLEAMAAGCFPVCSDVGIVPEVIENGVNGIIVDEKSPAAFREALQWCRRNQDQVRSEGKKNATRIAESRSWSATIPSFEKLYRETLAYAEAPLSS